MAISGEVLDALLAAGATAEMIVAAVKADAAQDHARAEAKRTKDRDRQRRHRLSRSVTVTNGDSADGSSLDKEAPQTPEEINPSPLPPVSSDEETPPDPSEAGNGKAEDLKPEHVVEAWNDLASRLGLPKAEKLTKARRRHAEARIREFALDDWHRAFAAIERSGFLRGENDRGWRADFDFLLQPKSFTKLIEGAYDH